nr:hypothetical protein [Gemmata obscuriglobus]
MQVPLHLFAHPDVFLLHLLGDFNTFAPEVMIERIGEIKVENHPAPVRPQRQHQVRIHHSGVGVEHEVRVQPPVRRVAGAGLPRVAFRRLGRAAL